jgi:hypothetical protein
MVDLFEGIVPESAEPGPAARRATIRSSDPDDYPPQDAYAHSDE